TGSFGCVESDPLPTPPLFKGREASSALAILDGRERPVVAAVGFGVPAALLVLELDRRRGAGNPLLGGGLLGRPQGGRVGRKRLREYAVGLVSPAAVVLDNLIGDFAHGSLCGLQSRLATRNT